MTLKEAIQKTWLVSEGWSCTDPPMQVKLTVPRIKAVFDLTIALGAEFPEAIEAAEIYQDEKKVAKLAHKDRLRYAKVMADYEEEHLLRIARLIMRKDKTAMGLDDDELLSLLERNPDLSDKVKEMAGIHYLHPQEDDAENPSESREHTQQHQGE